MSASWTALRDTPFMFAKSWREQGLHICATSSLETFNFCEDLRRPHEPPITYKSIGWDKAVPYSSTNCMRF
ncbi:hypothetical protein GCM10009069_29130 [Algimonas arctica]|uniref:Uncharacterized protein n=1 Tax=Algimonas arctica TaxID=1479486 RepID=A0A8J3CUW5_9PROT|nr:hypothetical protein GCM10009069_29130 [Algimonas arctica]